MMRAQWDGDPGDVVAMIRGRAISTVDEHDMVLKGRIMPVVREFLEGSPGTAFSAEEIRRALRLPEELIVHVVLALDAMTEIGLLAGGPSSTTWSAGEEDVVPAGSPSMAGADQDARARSAVGAIRAHFEAQEDGYEATMSVVGPAIGMGPEHVMALFMALNIAVEEGVLQQLPAPGGDGPRWRLA